MSEHMKRAEQLRAATDRHYNCAQSVLIPFAKEAGIDEEDAYKIASGFGSGMKSGSVCGAITGGVMALGILGIDTPANTTKLFATVKRNHEGFVDCKDLLALNAKSGGDKKAHCDGMVYEVVAAIDEILASLG